MFTFYLYSRDGLEDPLDDTVTVFQQLEQLCTVSRCEYEKTCTLLVQLFDQNAQNYQKLLHSPSRNPLEITVQEGQYLIWFLDSVLCANDHILAYEKERWPYARFN